MVKCEVCGGENFEKHAGFLYCAECQTQSQEYHEQEYDYHDHRINTIRNKKSPGSQLKKKQKFHDDGMWTTWEAFNYILRGMAEEMKKFGVPLDFELMVFKLWAAYLRKCEAVFLSRHTEKIPKLGYNFKPRDARILYNVDVSTRFVKERKTRSRSNSKAHSCNSSVSSITKRAVAAQKGKIIEADYQSLLSLSMQSSSHLADETLESLGRSSDGDVTVDSSEDNASSISNFKEMLRKTDFKMYKDSYRSQVSHTKYKDRCKRDVKLPGKNKLLSIIHLALLLTGSDIQLSDLLRFIREGHLSFAKVTHFFPKDMKLPRNDFTYIEVTSDSLMPTHLHQRKLANQLAYLLRIESLPVPNMSALVDRYCEELNLPEGIANLSKKVLERCTPSSIVPRQRTPLPSYEAWAMVSIIFVMKLTLGINDKTEIFLSHLAREINGLGVVDKLLFAFEDWQKYIECRKCILSEFHYPTVEQLSGSSLRSCEKFLSLMMKESKDEYRNERFVPYSDYYMNEKVLEGVKKMLNALSKPRNTNFIEFQPTLTPQSLYVKTISENLVQSEKTVEEHSYRPSKFPTDVLQQTFKHFDLQFAFQPEKYFSLLKERESVFIEKFGIGNSQISDSSPKKKQIKSILLNCSSNYWILRYPKMSSGQLGNFKEEVFEKTPKNFQWLMTESARMLEMNVRDIYDELLRLEEKFNPEEEEKKENGRRNLRKRRFNRSEKLEESKKEESMKCESEKEKKHERKKTLRDTLDTESTDEGVEKGVENTESVT